MKSRTVIFFSLLTIWIAQPLHASAQDATDATLTRTAKSKTIAGTRTVKISQTVFYDEPDTVYSMYGIDGRYPSLNEFIVVARGSLDYIRELLNNSLQALNEEPGTSLAFGNNSLYVTRANGMKLIWVYDAESSGYTILWKSTITRLLSQLGK